MISKVREKRRTRTFTSPSKCYETLTFSKSKEKKKKKKNANVIYSPVFQNWAYKISVLYLKYTKWFQAKRRNVHEENNANVKC